MSNAQLCKLCQGEQAIGLGKSSYKSANELLQSLFECYNIDVSILRESSCICQGCFDVVLRMSEHLEKWSNAQKKLQKDIDGQTVVPIKEEPMSLWDENDDAEFIAEGDVVLDDFEFPDQDELQTEDVEDTDGEESQRGVVELIAQAPATNHVVEISERDYQKLFRIKEITEESSQPLDWRSTPHKFFCVCLALDGLAISVLFKDKTAKRNIRMLCTCCHQVFSTMSDIQRHSSVMRANPEYWCRSCGIYFPKIADLKRHEKKHNHQLMASHMVIRCLKCPKIFMHLSDAVRHENIAHDEIPFKCKKCSMSFNSRNSFEQHEWKHKIHICQYPTCKQKFKVWEMFVNHQNWHKRRLSRCPVPFCNEIMLPGNHVKHLRTHSKTEVIFYKIADMRSPQNGPYPINTPKSTRKV